MKMTIDNYLSNNEICDFLVINEANISNFKSLKSKLGLYFETKREYIVYFISINPSKRWNIKIGFVCRNKESIHCLFYFNYMVTFILSYIIYLSMPIMIMDASLLFPFAFYICFKEGLAFFIQLVQINYSICFFIRYFRRIYNYKKMYLTGVIIVQFRCTMLSFKDSLKKDKRKTNLYSM